MNGQRATDCGFLIHPGNTFPVLAFHGTKAEQESLVNSILTGYSENCRCHPATNIVGTVVEIHLCPPHEFLNEYDRPGRAVEWTIPGNGRGRHSYGALSGTVSRVDRMMFARSMRAKLIAQEGILQHCVSCQSIYSVRHDCLTSTIITEGRKLPW